VRRSDVETAVDENYAFSTAGVAYRTIARLALILVQPAAVRRHLPPCGVTVPEGDITVTSNQPPEPRAERFPAARRRGAAAARLGRTNPE
jgi:hypothetical protein